MIKSFTHSHLTPCNGRSSNKTKSWNDMDLKEKVITCGSDKVSSDSLKFLLKKIVSLLLIGE